MNAMRIWIGSLSLSVCLTTCDAGTIVTRRPADDGEIVILNGMYWGLTNQRRCLGNGLTLAIRNNYSYVVPWWRIAYNPDGFDPATAIIEPLSFLYDMHILRDFAASKRLKLSTAVPEHKVAQCLTQLQYRQSSERDYTLKQLEDIANLQGVLCISDLSSIANFPDMGESTLREEVDSALQPSQQVQTEVRKIMQAVQDMYGTTDFIAMHGRTEDDFVPHCQALSHNHQETAIPISAHLMVRCFVDDNLLLEFLQHEPLVPSNAVVLITSDKHLDHFPLLCGVYQCIHKSEVWSPSASGLKHAESTLVLAYLDFLLASQAYAFYGNRFSSFSGALVDEFRRLNKTAKYYNPEVRGDNEHTKL